MKTQTLINFLCKNHAQISTAAPMRTGTLTTVLVSSSIGLLIFLFGWQIVDDITAPPFVTGYALKATFGLATALLAMQAWPALLDSSLPPKTEVMRKALIGLPVELMFFGVFAMSQMTWGPALSWRNGISCVASILLISLPIWAALIWQGRQGMPTRMRLTGLVSGLVASGFGVTIFALGCAETSPAYIAVWYGMAIIAAGSLGAIAAPRLLRW
jgi:hypothetical protein